MRTLLQDITIMKIYQILKELSKSKDLQNFSFWVEKRKGSETVEVWALVLANIRLEMSAGKMVGSFLSPPERSIKKRT